MNSVYWRNAPRLSFVVQSSKTVTIFEGFRHVTQHQNAVHGPRPLSRRLCTLLQRNARRCTKTRPHQYRANARYSQSSLSENAASNHLNPDAAAYSASPFTDRCSLTIHSGAGGNGCVSFLREKYVAEGPANGGDGGDGGSVYIQAVQGETSLHKLVRRGQIRAGRGGNGRGKSRGGERGADVLVTVPIGTIVRETDRLDPREEDAEKRRRARVDAAFAEEYAREKWIAHPGMSSGELSGVKTPRTPRVRSSTALAAQPRAPIALDLDTAMERPMLLAAGAVGGLGNPHFTEENAMRPRFATKGEQGMSISFELELKMLADVGLVGLPNAGKSTLLRALSNSRTRIGDWAFTTLQPNIGTVVLDDHKGRPVIESMDSNGQPRTNFTIADIPGLVEDAHLNRGLGLDFLRHVERAKTLAFVIDLASGDAVEALQALWREVDEYETLREQEVNARTELRLGDEQLETTNQRRTLPTPAPPISSKPWFVVANKADLPETSANFANLQGYIDQVRTGGVGHPSGRQNAWKQAPVAIPISAIRGEGVGVIPHLITDLL